MHFFHDISVGFTPIFLVLPILETSDHVECIGTCLIARHFLSAKNIKNQHSGLSLLCSTHWNFCQLNVAFLYKLTPTGVKVE